MKALVVGGGFSGCYAAQWLSSRGHQVVLQEASGALGGVMRDHITHDGPFFASCHYLNTDAFWFEAVAGIPGTALRYFDHGYGCWTDLQSDVRWSHAFAQPLVKGSCPPFADPCRPWRTLDERMADYPPEVRACLLLWMRRFVDPARLHPSAAEPLQVGRVGYPDDLEGVRRSRRESPLADRVLGVPRVDRDPPLGPEPAAIPRHGYSTWFDAWGAHLQRQGVTVRTSAPVRLRRGETDGLPVCETEEPFEVVVWCANPTPLSRLLLPVPLQTPAQRIRMLHVRLDTPPSLEPWYWQVFSNRSPILRGFWYPMDGWRLTLECMADGTARESILEDLRTMLRTWSWEGTWLGVYETRAVRYSLLERDDPERLSALAGVARQARMVVAGHECYGRNARLQALVDAMTAVGF